MVVYNFVQDGHVFYLFIFEFNCSIVVSSLTEYFHGDKDSRCCQAHGKPQQHVESVVVGEGNGAGLRLSFRWTSETGMVHERSDAPSINTVQAPH